MMAAMGSSFENAIAPWLVPYDCLKIKKRIGEGSAGTVYLAEIKETNVAVKKLTSPITCWGNSALANHVQKHEVADRESSLAAWRSLQREVNILVTLRHPNIVMFMGLCLDPPCLVTEWCARGSLASVLHKALTQPDIAAKLSCYRRLVMALEIAKGILQLHEHNPPILHRDMKTANVLVDSGWHCKISDFNLSYMEGTPAVLCHSAADNPRYMAPEVMHGKQHTKACDAYAYSIILWELLTWQKPWADVNECQVIFAVAQRGERPDVPENLQKLPGGTFSGVREYITLMEECGAEDPDSRPDFRTIISRLRKLIDMHMQSTHCRVSSPVSDPETNCSCDDASPPHESSRRASEIVVHIFA